MMWINNILEFSSINCETFNSTADKHFQIDMYYKAKGEDHTYRTDEMDLG